MAYDRSYSGYAIEDYNIYVAFDFKYCPGKEVLICGVRKERKPHDEWPRICELTKTAFSLKHWAFVASLKYMLLEKLGVVYREDYLRTLLHIINESPMRDVNKFLLRTGACNDRNLYSFFGITEKGLRMCSVATRRDKYVFPISYFRNFRPTCKCILKIKGRKKIKSGGERVFWTHSVYLFDRMSESIESNGHYDFCSDVNNQYIFN